MNINITDPIFALNYLFNGGPAPVCEKAADVDDTGDVIITDAIYSLTFLFLGGPAPRPPFPRCGGDLTADPLSCISQPSCP